MNLDAGAAMPPPASTRTLIKLLPGFVEKVYNLTRLHSAWGCGIQASSQAACFRLIAIEPPVGNQAKPAFLQLASRSISKFLSV